MTLLFYESNIEWLPYLRSVLLCFEVVSGPRINLDMNELISMGGMEDLGILTSEVWSYSWALVLPFGSFLKSNFVWDQRKGYLLVGNNTYGCEFHAHKKQPC